MLTEHLDVLIIGAGLSGIGAACLLQRRCPRKRFLLLEARADLGGTWDLFRYPGMRSDSDMFTLGYSFRPWDAPQALADGASILRYIRDTAREHGIDHDIRFDHRVRRASWSSADERWTVEVQVGAGQSCRTVRFSCNFLFDCAGYYSYSEAHAPVFAGSEDFKGLIVHPQFWPASLDYAGQRIVVIGSGATAVTLIPALSKRAAHVTMLQRSPSYVAALPTNDRLTACLRHLPPQLAYRLNRWRNVVCGFGFYQLCKRFPAVARSWLLGTIRRALGPDYDIATHFNPRYNPWDQRLCLAPDGDLFTSIRTGRATVCTAEIERFTATGIRLRDGRELAADLIVTATGLKLALLGEIRLDIDGRPVDVADALSYRGTMYSGIPNLASTFGYTNASWTLKCELICRFVCRLLNHMDHRGYTVCTPTVQNDSIRPEGWMNLTSGYIQRSIDLLPKQGSHQPWKRHQNYLLDLMMFYLNGVEDGALRFAGQRRR